MLEQHIKNYVVEDRGYETPCWIWQGKLERGYGVLYKLGRTFRMHRFMYEVHKGSIPDGLVIDHLCRNPSCCNPDHLEAVTNLENVRRGRWAGVMSLYCANGHRYTEENTLWRMNGGYRTRVCRTCHRERSLRQYHRKQEEKRRRKECIAIA